MKLRSILFGAALVAVGATAASAALVSIPNYSDQYGWHVGGVLEVLSGGTFRLDTGVKTATATAGAASLNKLSGVVTTEALATAAGASYTLTLSDSAVAATDMPFASVSRGSATAGTPVISSVTPGAGTLAIVVRNADASAAFNGTLKIAFATLKN